MSAEAKLETALEGIFRRWPAIVGFSIEDEGPLIVRDLETNPWDLPPRELLNGIAGVLLHLLDEEPAALELLRGRTFARVLH